MLAHKALVVYVYLHLFIKCHKFASARNSCPLNNVSIGLSNCERFTRFLTQSFRKVGYAFVFLRLVYTLVNEKLISVNYERSRLICYATYRENRKPISVFEETIIRLQGRAGEKEN